MVTIDTLPYLIWLRVLWTQKDEPHEVIKHITASGPLYECKSIYSDTRLWITQESLDIAIKVEQL